MKKIQVTVAEFRKNGGLLEKGRVVFDEELEEGVYETTHGTDKIVCYFGGIADTVHQDFSFVEIQCTPYYK